MVKIEHLNRMCCLDIRDMLDYQEYRFLYDHLQVLNYHVASFCLLLDRNRLI